MPIRAIEERDKQQILDLDQIIFREIDGGWDIIDYEHFFNTDTCYVVHAEGNPNEINGYIFARQGINGTYISNIGVKKECEGRGIGKQLMKAVMIKELERSKDTSFSVKLHVAPDNMTAISFYDRLGYKQISQDINGIIMEARELPPIFRNTPLIISEQLQNESSQENIMVRKALIIRNIDGIERDDLLLALEGLEPDDKTPQEFNQLIALVKSNDLHDAGDLTRAINLFKRENVRDYIYETVKAKTGNHVIYHLNGIEEGGAIKENNARYITDKLSKIPANTDFDMMYLGGGHGGPVEGSSNLTRNQLKQITDSLTASDCTFGTIVLGSCFSASYLDLYQPLLIAEGATISNSLECASDNNFKQAMEWMTHQREDFYSDADIRSSVKISREVRSSIRRIFEGRIAGVSEGTPDQYQALLNTYGQEARAQLQTNTPPERLEARVYDLRSGLFNQDLDNLITDMQNETEQLSDQKMNAILQKYPKLSNHIDAVSSKISKPIFFKELRNGFQPTPTSLVVSTASTVKMLDFNRLNEMPLHAEADFQQNYGQVLSRISQSHKFTTIQTLTQNFDGISAKRQFNQLFSRAIEATELARQERLASEQHTSAEEAPPKPPTLTHPKKDIPLRTNIRRPTRSPKVSEAPNDEQEQQTAVAIEVKSDVDAHFTPVTIETHENKSTSLLDSSIQTANQEPQALETPTDEHEQHSAIANEVKSDIDGNFTQATTETNESKNTVLPVTSVQSTDQERLASKTPTNEHDQQSAVANEKLPVTKTPVTQPTSSNLKNRVTELYGYGGGGSSRFFKHAHEAQPTKELQQDNKYKSIAELKGDRLKKSILDILAEEIDSKSSKEELDSYVKNIEKDPGYKVLAQGQGITTRLLGLDTDSVKAFKTLINEKEASFQKSPNKPS